MAMTQPAMQPCADEGSRNGPPKVDRECPGAKESSLPGEQVVPPKIPGPKALPRLVEICHEKANAISPRTRSSSSPIVR